MIIEAMAAQAREPTFCMGDDAPLSVLSGRPQLMYNYFKQRFAQVRRTWRVPCAQVMPS